MRALQEEVLALVLSLPLYPTLALRLLVEQRPRIICLRQVAQGEAEWHVYMDFP